MLVYSLRPRRPKTLAAGGLVFVVAMIIFTSTSQAQIAPESIAFDSELVLLERNDYGAYRQYTVNLAIRNGNTELSLNKDGKTATVTVPLDECLDLWQRIMSTGLVSLSDAPTVGLPPDQSHFTIQFRVVDERGQFRAYGVDSLSDSRYRDIVVAILDMADSYLEPAGEPEGGSHAQ